MRKVTGIAFGLITHVLFAHTVWKLFWFLKTGVEREGSLWVDLLLALQFCVIHSVILLPRIRERLTWKLIPSPFYGCFFCIATCACLLATIAGWGRHQSVLWELAGWPRTFMNLCFAGSWIALFYSLSLTGLGYQTGLTPWLYWLRNRPAPRRAFHPVGAYQWLRHPIYLSFLGLIWFTPDMTLDHAILTGVWTVYVFVGSYLKDQRLIHYLGDSYRHYQSQVPGYPGFIIGPLARVPFPVEQSLGSLDSLRGVGA